MSRAQLRALGLSDRGIAARVARGALPRRHQAVYSVGHTVLGALGHRMAAVLACGPPPCSATPRPARWGPRPNNAASVDVTLPGTGGRQRRNDRRIEHEPALVAGAVAAALND